MKSLVRNLNQMKTRSIKKNYRSLSRQQFIYNFSYVHRLDLLSCSQLGASDSSLMFVGNNARHVLWTCSLTGC